LPDGIFPYQNSQFGYIQEGLKIENVGSVYGHWEYFKAIWYILWLFGNFAVILVYFSLFGIFYQEKSGNPGHDPRFPSSPLALNWNCSQTEMH
jgi:hypothetical protein